MPTSCLDSLGKSSSEDVDRKTCAGTVFLANVQRHLPATNISLVQTHCLLHLRYWSVTTESLRRSIEGALSTHYATTHAGILYLFLKHRTLPHRTGIAACRSRSHLIRQEGARTLSNNATLVGAPESSTVLYSHQLVSSRYAYSS